MSRTHHVCGEELLPLRGDVCLRRRRIRHRWVAQRNCNLIIRPLKVHSSVTRRGGATVSATSKSPDRGFAESTAEG